ncbi:receptor-type tyrosine-protein phosphatase H-like, partial [Gracilinanus agilis]|uniref:receptor-type tyrosine-protein phosphatase H-like n=1 Tax=Gracilinanus agilis TaxID=191870 RepID=UPI001CFEE45D
MLFACYLGGPGHVHHGLDGGPSYLPSGTGHCLACTIPHPSLSVSETLYSSSLPLGSSEKREAAGVKVQKESVELGVPDTCLPLLSLLLVSLWSRVMSGLSPGPWHLLGMVLVLGSLLGSLAAAQDEISALTVDKQTNTSITLKWEAANSTFRYNVSWVKDGQLMEAKNISEPQYTVKDLEPGTMYEFTVRVEGSGFETRLNASTMPNEVRELRMEARSNSSVSLNWTVPDGPPASDYTYWVSWPAEGGPIQKSTEQTEYEVGGLDAATLYNFTVQAERNNVTSSGQSLQEAT